MLEAGILDGQTQLKLDGKVVTSKGKVRCAPGPDARPSPDPRAARGLHFAAICRRSSMLVAWMWSLMARRASRPSWAPWP